MDSLKPVVTNITGINLFPRQSATLIVTIYRQKTEMDQSAFCNDDTARGAAGHPNTSNAKKNKKKTVHVGETGLKLEISHIKLP